jgi:hypothetical protein
MGYARGIVSCVESDRVIKIHTIHERKRLAVEGGARKVATIQASVFGAVKEIR